MEQTGLMNSGTRAGAFALFGAEAITMIADTRWMMLAIFLCVVADFRYGWGESAKRYALAKEKGNEVLMEQYKWRTSRALRRSMNKVIDYIIWLMVGIFVGFAVLRPFGIDYIFGAVFATAISVGCELVSIIGHFLYLHGVKVEKKTITGFLKAVVIAFAKRKNRDVGEALEAGFNNIEKEKKNNIK